MSGDQKRRRTNVTLNRLKMPEVYRLAKFVEDNAGSIKEGKITMSQLAKSATQMLGLEITHNNINHAMKITGVKPPERKIFGKSGSNFITRKTARMLGKAIANLYQRFGEELPQDLKEWLEFSKPLDEEE